MIDLCDHCGRPGESYVYRGQHFNGLTRNRGEALCPRCLDRAMQADLDAPVGWAQVPAREYITPLSASRYR